MKIELHRKEVGRIVIEHIKQMFPMPEGYVYEVSNPYSVSNMEIDISRPEKEGEE